MNTKFSTISFLTALTILAASATLGLAHAAQTPATKQQPLQNQEWQSTIAEQGTVIGGDGRTYTRDMQYVWDKKSGLWVQNAATEPEPRKKARRKQPTTGSLNR
ncbi:MAG: hypothetical protein L6Q57_00750 [Alphaproteobacteria bacterium]|nr:hypothetical protein [Alphaproteobacteria bacterium]